MCPSFYYSSNELKKRKTRVTDTHHFTKSFFFFSFLISKMGMDFVIHIEKGCGFEEPGVCRNQESLRVPPLSNGNGM